MGSSISVRFDRITFLDKTIYKDVKKRLLNAIVKNQLIYYADYDFTAYDIICVLIEDGIEWRGTIRYHDLSGLFAIRKIVRLQKLQRVCKC